MTSYLQRVDRAVDETPEHRNRVVDTWRVIALGVVVFGHWLAASVWVMPDGETVVMNTLEWIPYSGWFTWVVQVMPIFFFVGGYANARALDSRTTNRRSWLTIRFRRLYAPAVPVIVVWTLLALVLRSYVDPGLLYDGVLNATIPLWFLAVYLTLVSIAPLTLAWWRRWGFGTVAVLAGAAIVVDIAYRNLDVPGVGWANLVFVWGTVHQLGYWWADRDTDGRVPRGRAALALSAGGLGALVATTMLGWYPVAMLTIPGGGDENITPPTFAIVLLALVQIGVILASAPTVRSWAHRRRTWRMVVGVSGFLLSIYVWHLTALSLVIAAGIFTFDGVTFGVEPGTAAWWATRPVFYLVLMIVTAAIVAVFARFEHDIDTASHRRPMPIVVVGMAATVTSLAATAFVYLVDRDGTITWWIPAVAVAAALVMGAYPAGWKRSDRSSENAL